MGMRWTSRNLLRSAAACCAAMLLSLAAAAQSAPVVLDRVVAVVNNRAILWSDIQDAVHLAALEPLNKDEESPDARVALEQLVSRTLIEQQIRQEDAATLDLSEKDLQTRLTELRKELPGCVRMACATDAGWKAFLNAHDLTQNQVENYLHGRLELLAFIEKRFKQGIRISQEDVEAYYRETLLPKYAKGEAAPAMKDVAPRIEEILLQQQVNGLFDAWLENLRKQGDVEILDPALESARSNSAATGAAR